MNIDIYRRPISQNSQNLHFTLPHRLRLGVNSILSVEGYEIGVRIGEISMDQDGFLYIVSDEGNLLILSRAPSDIKDGWQH